jgi:hypothetical protein
VKRIERTVVQLMEAQRLADERTEPHGRLALLLLDNLAETLIYREVEYQLAWSRMSRGLLKSLSESKTLTPEAAEIRADLSREVVSTNQEKKIRRYFGEKADYLARAGILDEAHARMLKKLHEYRNEAYHRDTIRPEALQSAVDIYFYLCCELMKALPIHSYIMSEPSKYLAPFAADLHGIDGFELQARVADHFLAERELNHREVNAFLRQHLVSRLADMRETLDSWAGEFPNMETPEELLHHCQVPDDAIKSVEDFLNIGSVPVPHDFASITAWEQRAASIDEDMAVTEAFVLFADIEDEFEELEGQIFKMSQEMDREIQHQIDVMRGK